MKENKDNIEDNIDNDNPLNNETTDNIINNNNLLNYGAIPSIPNVSRPVLTPLSQITENLYLGNLYDAQNISYLLRFILFSERKTCISCIFFCIFAVW